MAHGIFCCTGRNDSHQYCDAATVPLEKMVVAPEITILSADHSK
jgi:hypothetical protein